MTAKLATVDEHILASVEAAGAMDGGGIVLRSARDKPPYGSVQFDSGYLSPYFVTDPERMEVAFENAYILIHEEQIGSKQDLLPLLEQITKSGRPLVIIAEDVGSEALATLVMKKLRGPLQVAAVRAPGFGDQRKGMLQGIAILTGGRTITEGLDIQLKNIRISDLGRAAKITIDKNNTVVEVKAAYDRRIRMPSYANLSLPPEARNNATMTAHRELAPPEQCTTEEVQEHEHFQTCRRLFKMSVEQPQSGLSLVVNAVLRGFASEPVGRSRPRRASPGAATRPAGRAGDRPPAGTVLACRCDEVSTEYEHASPIGRLEQGLQYWGGRG